MPQSLNWCLPPVLFARLVGDAHSRQLLSARQTVQSAGMIGTTGWNETVQSRVWRRSSTSKSGPASQT
jgi:hypothetical protein